MNFYYFSQHLSQRLIERGVTSQFDDIHYCECEEYAMHINCGSGTSCDICSGDDDEFITVQAIHFSDLLLPENAKKAFSHLTWEYRTKRVLELIQKGDGEEVEFYIQNTML